MEGEGEGEVDDSEFADAGPGEDGPCDVALAELGGRGVSGGEYGGWDVEAGDTDDFCRCGSRPLRVRRRCIARAVPEQRV